MTVDGNTVYTLRVSGGKVKSSSIRSPLVADGDKPRRSKPDGVVAERDREPSREPPRESKRGGGALTKSSFNPTSEPSVKVANCWKRIRANIEQELNPHSFNTWIGPTVLLDIAKREGVTTLHFSVPNKYFRDWLSEHQHFFQRAATVANIKGKVICMFHTRE